MQNSLTELWSLMHFLMPNVFRSQREFQFWFSNPLTAVVEGKHSEGNKGQEGGFQDIVHRLHAVIRPFILRRLKADVATQLPKKYEHILKVPLSSRQRKLYEDFISRSSTRRALSSGGYLGMMSILMKLRMVCNHPDIFEPRVILSSFDMEPLEIVGLALASRTQPVNVAYGKPFATISCFHDWSSIASRELGSLDINGGIKVTNSKAIADSIARLQVGKRPLIEEMVRRKKLSIDARLERLEAHASVYSASSPICQSILNQNRTEMRKNLVSDALHVANRTAVVNRQRCSSSVISPVYGSDTRRAVAVFAAPGLVSPAMACFSNGSSRHLIPSALQNMVKNAHARSMHCSVMLKKFVCITPKARSRSPRTDNLPLKAET